MRTVRQGDEAARGCPVEHFDRTQPRVLETLAETPIAWRESAEASIRKHLSLLLERDLLPTRQSRTTRTRTMTGQRYVGVFATAYT